MKTFPLPLLPLFSAALLALSAAPPSRGTEVSGFEARQVHPLELAGDLLLALNSPAGTLAVYDLAGTWRAGLPPLRWEIPVGVEPVSVRARSATEAWVVNEVSDSLSVVDLEAGIVTATLAVPDEPSDLLFLGSRAVVSCARSNLLRVLDVDTHTELATVPLLGNYPTSLAASPEGDRVYVAFLLSGNRTTVLQPDLTPAQPEPTGAGLGTPPDTASIVPANDPRLSHKVYDHDVAVVDSSTWQVSRYLSGAGTVLRSLAVDPASGDLLVGNLEARNLVRFEPALRGHVADHRLSRYTAAGTGPVIHDLNPGIDHDLLPHPAARDSALADPAALWIDGEELWVAAFASDRIARVDLADGVVLSRTDLRSPGEGARKMRGPRGLALHPGSGILFVLNKVSTTLSALDADSGAVLAEFPVGGGDGSPPQVREGRGFLLDARLSGNGTVSCGTCHIDADRDGLAWDLGDPGGVMSYGEGFDFVDHQSQPKVRPFHPMKGPMVTQTLRGLEGGAPFHWRGDRPTLADFNATFVQLMGGDLLSEADLADLESYLFSLRHHPNPHRRLDDGLPETLTGGDPARGQIAFHLHDNHCGVCHSGPRGTEGNIDDFVPTDSRDPVKTPPLQTTYQRFGFRGAPGDAGTLGFGLNRNGTGFQLPEAHFYQIHVLTERDRSDVAAFILAFDSGTPAATGQARTVTEANRALPAPHSDLVLLEAAAVAGKVGILADGLVGGRRVRLQFDPVTGHYRDDSESATRTFWTGQLASGEALTFIALLPNQIPTRGPLP